MEAALGILRGNGGEAGASYREATEPPLPSRREPTLLRGINGVLL